MNSSITYFDCIANDYSRSIRFFYEYSGMDELIIEILHVRTNGTSLYIAPYRVNNKYSVTSENQTL